MPLTNDNIIIYSRKSVNLKRIRSRGRGHRSKKHRRQRVRVLHLGQELEHLEFRIYRLLRHLRTHNLKAKERPNNTQIRDQRTLTLYLPHGLMCSGLGGGGGDMLLLVVVDVAVDVAAAFIRANCSFSKGTTVAVSKMTRIRSS